MISPKQAVIPSTVLGTSTAILYTAPAGVSTASGRRFIVTSVVLCNNDTDVVTATLYVVPSGGSVGLYLWERPLGPKETKVPDGFARQVLNPGDTIRGKADKAASVAVMISGYEETLD